MLGTYLLQALATGTMLAGAQYVATWVMRSESAVTLLFVALVAPAVIATPGWERLSRRIGKERAFRISSTIFVIASASIVLALWMPGSWIYASVAAAGIAYAGMQALPMAMLPDVISHDERDSGPGNAGTFTGMWTASETVGFALGTTIVAVVLAITGYISRTAGDASAVMQPGSAVTGIVLIFSVVPAVLMLLSLATLARYRLQEWLNFISTEVHKQYSPLFSPTTPPETRQTAIDRLNSRFAYLNRELSGRSFLMGDSFTVADAYLFTVLNWARMLKMDMAAYPSLNAFVARVEARPAVQSAMRAEGLLK